MSDETRRDEEGRPVEGQGPEKGGTEGGSAEGGSAEGEPRREDSQPRDDELYTPQGGGGGTGAGPLRDVSVVEGAPRSGPEEDLREDVLRPGEVTLPQIGEAAAEAEEDEGSAPEVAIPEREEVSSFRLVMTLGVAGALAGALLVFVFLWSEPKILAYEAKVLREAVTEVLHGPERFESIFLLDGELVTAASLPQEVDTLELERVFLGYDESGEPIGFALQGEGFGFQDIISLIFGYDPDTNEILGMKVLSHLETPGLGDKIVKDSAFVRGFNGVAAPIDGVKPDRNTGEPDQVDMITGATISSEAVIEIINNRLAEVRDLLVAYEPTGGAQEEGQ